MSKTWSTAIPSYAAAALLLLGACARHETGAGAGTAQAASATPAAGPAPAASLCDRRLLAAADVEPILGTPVATTKSIPGDPQTCRFGTAGFTALNATLRPTNGRQTVDAWTSGKMPFTATPLTGAGDHAAWISEMRELDAEKGDVLCVVQVEAPRTTDSTAALQQKLAALCNKLFAADRG